MSAAEKTINIPLLRKVMDHITAHPEEHDQTTWGQRRHCGTTFCVAGWAVQFAGHEIVWPSDDEAEFVEDGQAIADVAETALGLTPWQAEQLFHQSFGLPQVWDAVEEITGGELTRPVPS